MILGGVTGASSDGGGTGSSPAPAGGPRRAVAVIDLILATYANAALGAGVVQIFATASAKRNAVIIRHCGGSGKMWVAYHDDVSSSEFLYELAAGDDPIVLNPGLAVPVYIIGEAATCKVLAYEARVQ